jgi:hypothetical protein
MDYDILYCSSMRRRFTQICNSCSVAFTLHGRTALVPALKDHSSAPKNHPWMELSGLVMSCFVSNSLVLLQGLDSVELVVCAHAERRGY